MKKSLVLATTLLALTPSANANDFLHNFNVGAGLGWNYGNFNYDPQEFSPQGSNYRSFDLSKSAPAGELSLGYGLKLHQTYLGLETSYLFTHLKRNKDVNSSPNFGLSTPSRIKSNGAFNAAVKLGYYIRNDFVGYIGAGIESRKFKVQYITVGQPQNSIDRSKRQTAFAGRLGFDYSVTPHMTIGTEYRKAFYKSKTFANGTTTLKFKPKTVDTILLNFRFKMDFFKNNKSF